MNLTLLVSRLISEHPLKLESEVEPHPQLAAVLGPEHVLGVLCGLITSLVEPGHIRHTGADPFIKFGELDNHPSERVERLHQTFERVSGLAVEAPPIFMWPCGKSSC